MAIRNYHIYHLIFLQVLNHPNVYKFMHIPVQSGSDAVLSDMKREYKRSDFTRVVDTLRKVSYTHYEI